MPPPQRSALEVALLLADEREPAPDRGKVAFAFLSALRALAREGPVALAIDDAFSPRPVRPGSLSNDDRCGEPPPGSAFSDELADLRYGWPTPPVLPFEPIPLHKMFNHRYHAFKVEFKTPRQEAKGASGLPPL